ncbi:hypothetical protein [Reyranella soli]|uniref:Uncharacterized protein n=1 Tax=Reyranella soli TaxID=1230389 RepID=A0A512NNB2_9HYPH|nr:hypothetical protein [Reyranella soli]GEP60443.1 hypothetical protein RSO01_76090 [Reyranella soli]
MKKAKVSVIKKKIGRPATGIGTLLGIRWHEPALKAIDDWRREQPDLPARGEAIRRLVEQALAKGGKR